MNDRRYNNDYENYINQTPRHFENKDELAVVKQKLDFLINSNTAISHELANLSRVANRKEEEALEKESPGFFSTLYSIILFLIYFVLFGSLLFACLIALFFIYGEAHLKEQTYDSIESFIRKILNLFGSTD